MKTKAQVLTALRMSGREFVEACRAIPADEFEAGRYENGWNARQILAHVAAIEWTYANLLEVAGRPASNGTPPARTAEGGMDAYNARQVEKRAGSPVPELLAEFERNRQRTIAAVEATPTEQFEREIQSAGGIRGTLGEVMFSVAAGHVRSHLADILGAQDRQPPSPVYH